MILLHNVCGYTITFSAGSPFSVYFLLSSIECIFNSFLYDNA